MNHLLPCTSQRIAEITRPRDGETKIGEKIIAVGNINNWKNELAASPAPFVLLGLPEDIGIRANHGRGGAWSAWEPALNALFNMQSNRYFTGEELLVLGQIDFLDLMEIARTLEFRSTEGIETARKLVAEIDNRVTPVIEIIAALGKIPLVIGGGHNNAYPIIRGVAEGLKQSGKLEKASVNVINCDAHTDFRATEGRHSGNGFRYAKQGGWLNRYAVVGWQESYTPQSIISELQANEEEFFLRSFDDLFIHHTTSGSFGYAPEYDLFGQAVDEACRFTKALPTGIELDIDIIENTPSSAKTSSGISANEARRFIYHCARETNAAYLHLAEAAPVLSHIRADNKTGKLLAYFVSDFIKGILSKR